MKLFKSTVVNGANTLLSRVMGFLRDVVLARVFGANAEMDAFIVAFRIPNVFRRLFAESGFAPAFVPVLTNIREEQGEAAVKDLMAHVFGIFLSVLSLVTILGVIGASVLVVIFAPGFVGNESLYVLSSELLAVCFPYLFFISLAALFASALNTYGIFGLPAFVPVILNICLIVGALGFADKFEPPVTVLAWSVFIAGVLQLAILLPSAARKGLLAWPKIDFRHVGVLRILKLLGPSALTVSVVQINVLIGTILASTLITGSVTWLYFADRLVELPLGVIGVSMATVVLPTLTRQMKKDPFAARGTIIWSIKLMVAIMLPATLGLFMLSVPIMSTLFYGKEFSQFDVNQSAYALSAYSIGLLAFVLVKILNNIFFAQENTTIPFKASIVAMVSNVLLSVIFMLSLRHLDLGHVGLALATALAGWFQTLWLMSKIKQKKLLQVTSSELFLMFKSVIATCGMCFVLFYFLPNTDDWIVLGAVSRIWQLAGFIGLGMLTYGAILWLQGVRIHHYKQIL